MKEKNAENKIAKADRRYKVFVTFLIIVSVVIAGFLCLRAYQTIAGSWNDTQKAYEHLHAAEKITEGEITGKHIGDDGTYIIEILGEYEIDGSKYKTTREFEVSKDIYDKCSQGDYFDSVNMEITVKTNSLPDNVTEETTYAQVSDVYNN